MEIDITLRDIVQNLPQRFIKLLTGKAGKKLLDTSLPEVKDRRVDLLTELEDGVIFHLELQASNDYKMLNRMLEYFILLQNKYPSKEIMQMVLYVGDEKLKMSNKIELKNLKFEYILKDIREIECEELLNSSSIEDKILSVLCRIEEKEKFLNKLIEEILKLKIEERSNYLLKLFKLSRLRIELHSKLEEVLKEGNMPITIPLEKDPYYLKGFERGIERGIERGKKEGILEGIEKGIIEEAREMVIEAYRVKFGIIDKKIREAVESFNDRKKLKKIHEEIIKSSDVEKIDDMILKFRVKS